MTVAHATGRARARTVATAATAVAALAVVDPNSTHVPLCPFHAITGMDCPLCGGLRAVHALTRGSFTAAVHDNVLVVAALPIAILFALWVVAGRPGEQPIGRRAGSLLLVLVMICFAVVRNLPFATALRPA
ncbi:MAG TPA: DUF2752 domain-containing protein [Jatrophihabitantaceae bacterium]|jgi:hypothetical protein|nr:DUF2752 domain-containing protein [Jatrophihabitantaceae bacterium]